NEDGPAGEQPVELRRDLAEGQARYRHVDLVAEAQESGGPARLRAEALALAGVRVVHVDAAATSRRARDLASSRAAGIHPVCSFRFGPSREAQASLTRKRGRQR